MPAKRPLRSGWERSIDNARDKRRTPAGLAPITPAKKANRPWPTSPDGRAHSPAGAEEQGKSPPTPARAGSASRCAPRPARWPRRWPLRSGVSLVSSKHRVRRLRQRRFAAPHVALVARLDVHQHVVIMRGRAARLQLGQPPRGAHLGAGGDEQFDRRVRRNDRADVAPVEHRPAVLRGEVALALDQRRAHARDRPRCGSPPTRSIRCAIRDRRGRSAPGPTTARIASNSLPGSPPKRLQAERDGAIQHARCPCAAGRNAPPARGRSSPSRSPPVHRPR